VPSGYRYRQTAALFARFTAGAESVRAALIERCRAPFHHL